MSRLILVFGLLSAATTAAATSPIAEILCSNTEDLERRLTLQMGNERTASGLRGPEQIMEVWTGVSGDWVLVVRYASGRSCIVAMGNHWIDENKNEQS